MYLRDLWCVNIDFMKLLSYCVIMISVWKIYRLINRANYH